MQDFEKLGVFYLGRQTDAAGAPGDLLLYDANDLSTHAVIIGMTGSGKTGLGLALLEEAAIDHVPVLALDPKGDLGNLLLTFPALEAADFEPWVDPREAQTAGRSVAEYAAEQAERWRTGLAEWGQGPERIARLRAAAEFALYTPGSTAGRPIAVLGSLAAPPPALRDDGDLYRQHVQGTVTGLLTLAGITADPVSGREHILLATVLDQAWQRNRSLDLAALIGLIQQPGVDRIGVLDLESFYPARDRFSLALRLNNLLAAPGFDAWTRGEPLAAGSLLYTPAGRPRAAVISVAHLGDAERMFFLTMLLNELIGWMRTQPGTSSLRAILYMDEVMGYLPPVANPPSKGPLLTLLKQARAYGLGVVLATQNPVDLDYKALSNAGTWFIGRLQTDQDRRRVRDGLLGAAAGAALDPARLDELLAGLGKRRFLLHNVHESGPVLFQTRWAMSYLRGPLTRDDIRRLNAGQPPEPPASPATTTAPTATPPPPTATARPVLPPAIPVLFGEPGRMPGQGERLIYLPRLLGAARIHYLNARQGVDLRRDLLLALEPGSGSPDWDQAEALAGALEAFGREPEPDAAFGECPPALLDPASLRTWQTAFRTWLRNDCPVVLWRSPALKLTSAPDETEAAFRIRLQQRAREDRDRAAAALRQKYAARFTTLNERLRRAEQAVDREQQQAAGAKLDTALGIGTAVLGSLLGRKAVSATSAGRLGSAARKAANARKQAGDVARATETVASLKAQLAALEAEADAAVAELAAAYDAQAEQLEEIPVRPRATDISVQFLGIGWLPFIEDAAGNLTTA